MMTLVVGYHFLKQGGIHLSTFDRDNHIGNSLNLTYIKLIHVVKILLTVEGFMENRSARSSTFNPSRSRTITKKNCS